MKKLLSLAAVTILLLSFIGRVLAGEVLPWGVSRIRASLVWNINTGMKPTAVVDSGIDYNHIDLKDNVQEGVSFIPPLWDYMDYFGHGTHIAGTIGAVDNEVGVIGVAPKAPLYPVKVYYMYEPVDPKKVAQGIRWAADHGIKIISVSLVFNINDTDLFNACNYAYYEMGALLIAAAGNENGPVLYPAKYESVIAVGAINQSDKRWVEGPDLGSNYGFELELVAPGVDINSTWPGDTYMVDTGTSYAVSHVTGVAALIYASKIDPEYDFDLDESWDNFEVRQKLRDTALDLGTLGKDDYYGYGLVNAWYANQRPAGDVNSDHYVNIKDVIIVSNAYGSKPDDPNWDPRADIIIDNAINIKDMVIVTSNFGKSDP